MLSDPTLLLDTSSSSSGGRPSTRDARLTKSKSARFLAEWRIRERGGDATWCWELRRYDRARLKNYWTKGEGAVKIKWGTPHDFYVRQVRHPPT